MAKPKPAPVPAAAVAYKVKGAGWINGTWREDGEIVNLTPGAARVYEMAYRLEAKDAADRDAKAKLDAKKSEDIDAAYAAKAKDEMDGSRSPASDSERAPAADVADEDRDDADEPASHVDEPAVEDANAHTVS